MYKESHLSDQINNIWIDKSTNIVNYVMKLTTCGKTKVQRKSFIWPNSQHVDRQMYKESNLSDQINNMGIDKCTKKVI
jgi:hypothetical protein